MSIVDSYLTQTVTWERVTGTDEWGKPVTESSQVSARIESSNKLIRTVNGTEAVSRAKVLLLTPVEPGDWLLLPDGTRQQPLDVRVVAGLAGESHREVYL